MYYLNYGLFKKIKDNKMQFLGQRPSIMCEDFALLVADLDLIPFTTYAPKNTAKGMILGNFDRSKP